MSTERRLSQTIYPLALEPKDKPAIWGGELWECWDENRIRNGPLAGKTVAELRAELGAQLLGDLDPQQLFPVLTKIIDARDSLSVQVHPDDAYAQRVEHQHNGKTECWYILGAKEGAELIYGWAHDTSRAEYERRVADGTLGDILRRVPVKPGEVYYLPAGTLHAIGAGITLFETQQASDLTYRIFDWNRLGADGKPRPLHVAKAADVLDYHQGKRGAAETIAYHYEGLDRVALIGSSRFFVERVTATDEPASIDTGGRPAILMTLDRPMTVRAGDTALTLDRRETVLVPAAAQWYTVSSADSHGAPFMLVTPPESTEELVVRLLAAGIDQTRIDRFMAQFT
ncbi:MAG TPA: type I phosphomannose isomerase catalytic subunit [Candidatus Acidoferrales bacterium]|nr:type I phosphomannose isomerase catalytic subunit [Candidatus Acidoferrales bacterium]